MDQDPGRETGTGGGPSALTATVHSSLLRKRTRATVCNMNISSTLSQNHPFSVDSPKQEIMTQTEHEGCAPLPTPASTASYWHKDPSKILLNHRTTSDLPSAVDVVVVGSGIVGAFAAWSLLQDAQGDRLSGTHDNVQNVLMLEAREACWGATGRVGSVSL